MEFTLLGAVFVAIVPLYLVIYWEAKRGNAASCTRNLWDVALTGAIVGLFAGRIAAMVAGGVNPLTNPADLLVVRCWMGWLPPLLPVWEAGIPDAWCAEPVSATRAHCLGRGPRRAAR